MSCITAYMPALIHRKPNSRSRLNAVVRRVRITPCPIALIAVSNQVHQGFWGFYAGWCVARKSLRSQLPVALRSTIQLVPIQGSWINSGDGT